MSETDSPEVGSSETLDAVDVNDIEASTDAIMSLINKENDADTDVSEKVSDEENNEETNAESTEPKEDVEDAEATQENDVAESDDEEFEEPETYTVKVNGEDIEVTFQELKDGYSKDSDYRRKSMELAEQRKQFTATIESIEVDKQRYQEGLTQALHYANNFDPLIAEAQKTDWANLSQTDPTEYTRKKAAVEQRVAEIQYMQSEQNRLDETKNKQIIQQENALLVEKIPEWKDENVRIADFNDITEVLRGYGFNDQELFELVDHRAYMLARDAMKYRKIMKAKENVGNKKVKAKAPKMQKPGAQPDLKTNKNANKALLRKAKESGRTDNIVDAIMKNL